MDLHLQYITNEKGISQAVVIPQKEWEIFQKEYFKMKKKLEILLGIENALQEVDLIQTGKKKGKSLQPSFMNFKCIVTG
ncbi:MAG: hypothetical protein WCP32_16885 [Bacteroidota bacterium]